jgi:hypothetical protein
MTSVPTTIAAPALGSPSVPVQGIAHGVCAYRIDPLVQSPSDLVLGSSAAAAPSDLVLGSSVRWDMETKDLLR